jgi:BirA family biotin operon repressor/biotin-[acetyl-CoA-carboxylase] ligase
LTLRERKLAGGRLHGARVSRVGRNAGAAALVADMMRPSQTRQQRMKVLLEILRDGRFHSGEELAQAGGVSRSAVWKRLQKIEAELGVTVHAVKGRGYRLASPLSLLTSASALEAAAGCPVHILDSVDSTNAQVQRLLSAGVPAPFSVIAERQTAGRGRRGREWLSPFAENIYYSTVIQVDGGARALEGLSLSVGLAVRNALADQGLVSAGLKWPNDILIAGRKIAGILLEVSGDPADRCHVVIGVGVNVNMQSDQQISQPWTSIALAQNARLIDRQVFAQRLCARIAEYVRRHIDEGFAGLRAEWEEHHLWKGRGAVLSVGERRIEGVVHGVDVDGALQLEVGGVLHSFSGGELSLRLADDS